MTRIRLPAKCPAMAVMSVRTGRRPSRSLIRGSRTPSIRALPLMQLVHRRDHLGHQPAALRLRAQVADGRAARAGDRDDQDRGPGLRRHLGHRRAVPEHRDAADAQPALVRVVVQQGDRPVSGLGIPDQPEHQDRAGLAGPEHDDVGGLGGRRAGPLPQPRRGRAGRRAWRRGRTSRPPPPSAARPAAGPRGPGSAGAAPARCCRPPARCRPAHPGCRAGNAAGTSRRTARRHGPSGRPARTVRPARPGCTRCRSPRPRRAGQPARPPCRIRLRSWL